MWKQGDGCCKLTCLNAQSIVARKTISSRLERRSFHSLTYKDAPTMALMCPEKDTLRVKGMDPDDPELKVYNALSEMGDEYTVYHSLRYIDFDREFGIPEGEIDFVVVNPHKGILVLEIKGGSISFNNGVWYQNGREMNKDPFDQARRNEYEMIKKLRQEWGVSDNFPYAYSVCFPSCDIPNMHGKKEKSNLESREITIGANDLISIEDKIGKILDLMGKEARQSYIGETNMEKIRSALNDKFELSRSISTEIEETTSHLLELDQRQQDVLDGLNKHKEAAISGPAGSGKTVLAAEKARRLGAKGREVLLTMYNIPISKKLADEFSNTSQVEVDNIHSWGKRMIMKSRSAEWPQTSYIENSNDFWDAEFPILLHKAIEDTGLSYDSVVVDEAQDLNRETLETIRANLSESGSFYVFFDPKQNIYDVHETVGLDAPSYALSYVYRSPRKVVQYINENTKFDVNPHYERSNGKRVKKFEVNKDRNEFSDKLNNILLELSRQNVNSSEICILVRSKNKFVKWIKEERIKKYSFIESEWEPNVTGVRVASLGRFKGLESGVIICCHIPEISEVADRDKKLYVSLTRSKVRAYLLCAN